MSIKDGDTTTTTAPQHITASVDPYAVAQAVREIQKQEAATQKKESRFQSKINSLLASGNVDKDNLTEITSLQQAAIDDLREEFKNSTAPDMVKMTNARYSDALSDALEKHIDGDEPLEKSAKLLEYNIGETLKKDTDFMRRLNNGEIDKRHIAKIAKETVESFSKEVLGRDKPAKAPNMTGGVASAAAAKAIENGTSAASIEEISEPHRRESYNKLYSAGMRWGKMSPEKAREWAYNHATRPYKK